MRQIRKDKLVPIIQEQVEKILKNREKKTAALKPETKKTKPKKQS